MTPWWIPDPAQVARVNAILLRFDARRAMEAAHADIGLKFVPPVLSESATWEATWDGGQAQANIDTELYALVCERLGSATGGAGDGQRGHPPPRYRQAAALVRARIAAGDLASGEPAPSAAALARATGFATLTCRKAINTLIKDGTLVPGPSPNARPHVAGPGNGGQAPADAARDLSAALAAGLTQKELAGLIGCSVTTVGHAGLADRR